MLNSSGCQAVEVLSNIVNAGFFTLALWYLYKIVTLLNDGIVWWLFAGSAACRIILSFFNCQLLHDGDQAWIVSTAGLRVLNGFLMFLAIEKLHRLLHNANNQCGSKSRPS